MPKKRKDVTFDGDLNKGGSSSGRVEDPNNLSNSSANQSGSNDDADKGISARNPNDLNDSENENSNEKNDEQQEPSNKNEDNKPYTEEPNEQAPSRVTEGSPQNLDGANGGGNTPSNDNSSENANDVNNNDSQNTSDNNDTNSEPTPSNLKDNKNDDNNSIDDKDSKDNNSVTDNTEKEDKTFSSEDGDDSAKGGIAGKLTGASDAVQGLQKAKKLKDISEMSKEEAGQELKSVALEVGKMKVKAAIWGFISPYLLPIIGILLVIIMIFMMMVGILSSTSNDDGNKQQGCKRVKENTSDVKNSKDAEKNAKTIYDYEMKHVKGATSKGVAAHLGNLYIESARTFDPKTIQGNNSFKASIAKDASAGGYAFGIAQWDSGRRVNLLKHAESEDKKWNDLGVQLDFMLNHDSTDSDVIKKLLKKDGDIKGITEDIMTQWERAGDTSSISERQAAASKYYAKFGGSDSKSGEDSNIDDSTDAATDNSDAEDNSGCNSDGEDTGGKVGKSVKANGDSGEIKEKWDSRDKIPDKYKKYVKIPEFKDSFLEGSPFAASSALKGQCTELTWAYMSAMWSGEQPTNGNGGDLHKSYKDAGAKVTSNPTVGYGFSSFPPYAGAGDASVGHTGVVAGVLPDGKWIMANYNLNLEAPDRKLTFALVDGNKKEDGVKFFSGVGDKKKKVK